MSHIWSVKRSDKKIAPHLKRQEKCHETKLYDVFTKIYLKMFNLYMPPFSMDLVNCVLFEVSRGATRKMRHIWSAKRSDKKNVPHLKRQEKCPETKLYDVLTKIYLKMFNLHMLPFSMDLVNSYCVLFEVSREATRKMCHIWSVKRNIMIQSYMVD